MAEINYGADLDEVVDEGNTFRQDTVVPAGDYLMQAIDSKQVDKDGQTMWIVAFEFMDGDYQGGTSTAFWHIFNHDADKQRRGLTMAKRFAEGLGFKPTQDEDVLGRPLMVRLTLPKPKPGRPGDPPREPSNFIDDFWQPGTEPPVRGKQGGNTAAPTATRTPSPPPRGQQQPPPRTSAPPPRNQPPPRTQTAATGGAPWPRT